ncbi:MAG: hypothetical protein M1450_01995 [Patescibacteria group bacterium]|nr:hypothetical protein [Patescibacteria group bacterium]
MGRSERVKGLGKNDSHLADRFKALSGIFAEGLPKPRIESTAQKAQDKLLELRGTLGKVYLTMGPQGDVLTDVYGNYLFLVNDIFPIVSDLLQRTKSGIPLGKNSVLGCRFVSDQDGGENKVELEIFDGFNDFDDDSGDDFEAGNPKITSLADIQRYWDEGDEGLRKSLRKFSKKSKNKLLKIFEEFVDKYCD